MRKYDSVLLAWFILAAAALFSFSKKNPFHGRETTTIMNATSKELLFSIHKNVQWCVIEMERLLYKHYVKSL